MGDYCEFCGTTPSDDETACPDRKTAALCPWLQGEWRKAFKADLSQAKTYKATREKQHPDETLRIRDLREGKP